MAVLMEACHLLLFLGAGAATFTYLPFEPFKAVGHTLTSF